MESNDDILKKYWEEKNNKQPAKKSGLVNTGETNGLFTTELFR